MSEEKLMKKILGKTRSQTKSGSKYYMVDFIDGSRYTFFKAVDVGFIDNCAPGEIVAFIGWSKGDWCNGKEIEYYKEEEISSIEGSDALTDLIISVKDLMTEILSELKLRR